MLISRCSYSSVYVDLTVGPVLPDQGNKLCEVTSMYIILLLYIVYVSSKYFKQIYGVY